MNKIPVLLSHTKLLDISPFSLGIVFLGSET